MPKIPLVDRMRKLAEDHEKCEQGGGASMLLNEGADALERAIAMLHSLECAGGELGICPECGELPRDDGHAATCEFGALIRELAS